MTAFPQSLLATRATSKGLKKALSDQAALVERDRLQVRAVAAAENELAAAEKRDIKAAADALRNGESMPASQLPEQRARLDEMRREAAALALAVRGAREAVASAVDANRPAWREAHQGVSDQRRQELIAAVDAFDDANEALRAALEADAFLFGGHQRAVGVVPLQQRNHELLSFAGLMAAIRTYAAGEAWHPPGWNDPANVSARAAAAEAEAAARSANLGPQATPNAEPPNGAEGDGLHIGGVPVVLPGGEEA